MFLKHFAVYFAVLSKKTRFLRADLAWFLGAKTPT
jgi:hypothetical protein